MSTAETMVLDIEGIKAVLPHRYPILLVDRVLELVPGESIVAVKNVTADEPVFSGHFPAYPVMPGVYLVEALAQAGAIMMIKSMEDGQGKIPLFAGIDRARFRRQVVPGDQLILQVRLVKARGATCKLSGRALVGDQVAAEAEIMAMLGDPA